MEHGENSRCGSGPRGRHTNLVKVGVEGSNPFARSSENLQKAASDVQRVAAPANDAQALVHNKPGKSDHAHRDDADGEWQHCVNYC
jgi:hypothetical protein